MGTFRAHHKERCRIESRQFAWLGSRPKAGLHSIPRQDGNWPIHRPDSLIEEINQRHAVVMVGGKCCILNEIIDPTFNRPDFTLSTMADFKNRYNNRRIGETCIATYWLRHPKRRQFEGIVFAPKMETPNHYNLWCGFVVEPKKGNWSKIVREGVDTDPFLSGT